MLVRTTCPGCGANLEVDDSRQELFCTYCGTKMVNMAQRVEINQNVNVSGTVQHVIDRSGEPNLIIDYASIHPGVRLVVRIATTGQKNVYLGGQRATYHLQPGKHTIVLKIGKINYNRIIYIPEDNRPVRINAAYDGRGRINVDQPPVNYTNMPNVVNNPVVSDGKKMSGMAIAAFVLSLTYYLSVVGLILGIIDIVRKDPEKKHGLAIAAVIIGGIVSLSLFVLLANNYF